ncbi:MAG: ferredoxin [Firmicutes bacterium HGW-Firmicutes-8]|nr:MAG: ferredoxin [Firmicutes bacterium HGW-Firmicutes-8]
MTLQELEQLKQRILSERCMAPDRKSPRVTVGLGTCGVKSGAGRVLEVLRRELRGNENIVVTQVGCIGLCSYEPVMEVAMPGSLPTIYCFMTPEKAETVVKEHILNGRPVKQWML